MPTPNRAPSLDRLATGPAASLKQAVDSPEGGRSPRGQGSATAAGPSASPRSVAYVMNGYPRLSETFITHEIHQLERLGMDLRLYSVKRENEPKVHPVVAAIRAPLTYLPKATSLSGAALPGWLADNLPTFWRAHARVALRHPLRWMGALGTALGLAWRHRGRDDHGRSRLRKVFIKEFLQAGEIAADVMRQGDVGHLHGHFCHGVATITWLAARMTGLSYSFTAHAKDIYQPELNPGDLLERKMHGARFVATCTCANATVLRARHPRPCEVHAIYHGLDTDWFAPPTQRPTVAPGTPPLILAVGRFVEKKGFDQLIEACALLRRDGVPFRCMIIGESGPALNDIRQRIERHGMDEQVQLKGAVTQDELRGYYAQARLFALPCQVMDDGDRDGFPNVLAESMAMGVPVVTTNISGIPEMIDSGVHGLLVEPRSPAALAEALRSVLVDDEMYARLAREGRQRICDRFDSRRTTQELRDLFLAQLQPSRDTRALARAEAST
ncbi:glycosyltransferase family 4 protein [Ideonella sp. A 288]|uniref:glycosyltransferase family 4 protein n=1 Tax=Ideonella sp. A 288 TaxID=1962181 RepID=UPI000B4A59E8|nr:glycosyltransferase family 4 protein [Ideonella sp. A 288]